MDKYEKHNLQATGSVCCVKITSRECDNSAVMPIKREELSIQAISMKEGFKEAPPVQQLHSSKGNSQAVRTLNCGFDGIRFDERKVV